MDLALVLPRLVAAGATATDGFREITALDYVPESIEPPVLFVADVNIDFDKTMNRGLDEVLVTLRFLCSRTDDREGQHQLAAFLSGSGSASLKAALESARGAPGVPALGGACDGFHVQKVAGYRWYVVGAATYVGADITVRIIGSGT